MKRKSRRRSRRNKNRSKLSLGHTMDPQQRRTNLALRCTHQRRRLRPRRTAPWVRVLRRPTRRSQSLLARMIAWTSHYLQQERMRVCSTISCQTWTHKTKMQQMRR
jgi:hypothetical protein